MCSNPIQAAIIKINTSPLISFPRLVGEKSYLRGSMGNRQLTMKYISNALDLFSSWLQNQNQEIIIYKKNLHSSSAEATNYQGKCHELLSQNNQNEKWFPERGITKFRLMFNSFL